MTIFSNPLFASYSVYARILQLSTWFSKHGFTSGNLRKKRHHVVCSLGQSAVFRNFNSANYSPHSANYQHPDISAG